LTQKNAMKCSTSLHGGVVGSLLAFAQAREVFLLSAA
jgi:hypothetical protein